RVRARSSRRAGVIHSPEAWHYLSMPTRTSYLVWSALVGAMLGSLPGCPEPAEEECRLCMNVADACCVNGKCVGCGPETSAGWAETGESGEPPAETGCEDCDEEDFEDCPLGGELSAEPLAQLN